MEHADIRHRRIVLETFKQDFHPVGEEPQEHTWDVVMGLPTYGVPLPVFAAVNHSQASFPHEKESENWLSADTHAVLDPSGRVGGPLALSLSWGEEDAARGREFVQSLSVRNSETSMAMSLWNGESRVKDEVELRATTFIRKGCVLFIPDSTALLIHDEVFMSTAVLLHVARSRERGEYQVAVEFGAKVPFAIAGRMASAYTNRAALVAMAR